NNRNPSQPRFSLYSGPLLVKDAGFSDFGPTAVAYADLIGTSGVKDLVVGGVSSGDLKIYPGLGDGSVSKGSAVSLPFLGAATVALAADFTLDGRVDLVVGTDNFFYAAPGLQG